MRILTLDNYTYTLEKIPEWVDEKLRFAVLDNANPEEPDFLYIPIIFLESINFENEYFENDDSIFDIKRDADREMRR